MLAQEMRDGRLAMIDSPDLFAGLLLELGSGAGSRAPFPTVFQFGPNPGLGVAQYTVKLETLSAHKPAYCE
jgi:hypothetical protein